MEDAKATIRQLLTETKAFLAREAPPSDEEFDRLFDDVRQLSREQMLSPAGTRAWQQRRRLDAAIRGIILTPQSATIRQLRRELADTEISSSTQDIIHWFRHLLG